MRRLGGGGGHPSEDQPDEIEDLLFEPQVMLVTSMIGPSGMEGQNCSGQEGQNR